MKRAAYGVAISFGLALVLTMRTPAQMMDASGHPLVGPEAKNLPLHLRGIGGVRSAHSAGSSLPVHGRKEIAAAIMEVVQRSKSTWPAVPLFEWVLG
jgi:hypothetical protein